MDVKNYLKMVGNGRLLKRRRFGCFLIITLEAHSLSHPPSLIGEGFDLPGISTIFLTTPVKSSGRLIQYIGRALRPAPGKDCAVIFDFVDVLNPVFEASAKSRHYIYQQQQITILSDGKNNNE